MTNRKISFITLILSLMLFFCATTLNPMGQASAATYTPPEEQVSLSFSNFTPSSIGQFSVQSVGAYGSRVSPAVEVYVYNDNYEIVTVGVTVDFYKGSSYQSRNSTITIGRNTSARAKFDFTNFNMVFGESYHFEVSVASGSNTFVSETKILEPKVKNTVTIGNKGYYYQDDNDATKYYSASPFNVTWTEGAVNEKNITSATVNGVNYTYGSDIDIEGENVVKLSNGYYDWQYTLVVDKSAPTIAVTRDDGKTVNDDDWFSDNLTVTIDDGLPFTIEYGDGHTTTANEFEIKRSDFTGDTLTIKATDSVGNVATWTANCFNSSEFTNENLIANSYKVPSWYNVKLPKSRYTTLTDLNYSFSTYDVAVEFAIKKEWDYQVVTSSSGGWAYGTTDNYSNKVVYGEHEKGKLDIIIEKWAKTYITGEQTFSMAGNDYYVEPSLLGSNEHSIPDVLTGYSDSDSVYLINGDYVFVEDAARKSKGFSHSITVKYLGEVIKDELKNTEKQGEFTVRIADKKTFSEYQEQYELAYQGYYLVTESDELLNVKRYLVYYDLTAPTVTLTGYRGSNNEVSNNAEISTYEGDVHFTKVEFSSFSDNREIPDNLLIKINGRGYDEVLFNSNDVLPTLCWQNDNYGLYNITVYDRSCNARYFEFYVAPEVTPGWTYTSLSSQEQLKVTFDANYRYNSIMDLKIYRIKANESEEQLLTDSNGTTIDISTLEYIITVGGKYQAEITDAFGRTVRTNVIFFKKDLPEGTIKGVTAGGVTRRDVTFSCAERFNVTLYVTDDGTRVPAKTDLYKKDTQNGQTVLQIIINPEKPELSSHKYLILVENPDNTDMFIEYAFEIDAIGPVVTIHDGKTGVVIEPGAVVTKNGFYLTSDEPNVTYTYYINKYSILNNQRYKAGDTLYGDGTYYFTAKDYLGNTSEIQILVDATVSYTIDGNYDTNGNGEILAKEKLKFTVTEPTSEITIKNGAYTYDNGDDLIDDGTYSVKAIDQHGNVLELTIKIDTSIPVITLEGVDDGGSTKKTVTVRFNEGTARLTNSKGVEIENVPAVTNGQVFNVDGDYYITVTDEVGNSAKVSFTIRTTLYVTANIVNGQITTGAVEFDYDSDVTFAATLNGVEITPKRRYSDKGDYVLTATDEIGNELVFEFRIIEREYKELDLLLPSGWTVSSVQKNGSLIDAPAKYAVTGNYELSITDGTKRYELSFIIDATPPTVNIAIEPNCAKLTADENVVTATLYKDGTKVSYRFGDAINESGTYRLEVTDKLGNTAVYDFEVPFALNVWAVVIIVVVVIVVLVVAIILLKSKKIKI